MNTSTDLILDLVNTISYYQRFQNPQTLQLVRRSIAVPTSILSTNLTIKSWLNLGLLAIRLLATYLNDPSTKEIAMLQMKEWLSDSSAANSKTLRIIAATLYMYDDNCKEAMKTIGTLANFEQ